MNYSTLKHRKASKVKASKVIRIRVSREKSCLWWKVRLCKPPARRYARWPPLPSTRTQKRVGRGCCWRQKATREHGGLRCSSPFLTTKPAHWSDQTRVSWRNTQSHKRDGTAKALFPSTPIRYHVPSVIKQPSGDREVSISKDASIEDISVGQSRWYAPMHPWQSWQGQSSYQTQGVKEYLNQTAYLLLSCNARSTQSLCPSYTAASPTPAGSLSWTLSQRGRCKVHWVCLLT